MLKHFLFGILVKNFFFNEQFFHSVKSNYRKMKHDDIKADIRLSIEKVKETVNFNNYYKHSYEIIQSY